MWSTAESWSGQAIGFVIFTVLAIFLGPRLYGLMAMAMTVSAVSEIIIVGGFAEGLIQRERLEPQHIDSAFWLLIGLAVCLAVAAQLCATPIAAAFNEPLVADMIRWLSVLPVLHALSAVPAALLTREMRFDRLALRSVLGLACGGIVGIGMALKGFGAWSLVGHQLTQQTVIALVLWLTSGWRPRPALSMRHLRELMGFGSQVIGLKLVTIGEQQLMRIIIGASLGPAALGLFHLAWRLLDILYASLFQPLALIAMPAFSRMQSDLPHVRRALHEGTRLSTLIGFPISLGLATVAPDLIPYLFGQQWSGSVRVTQILAAQGALWSFTHFYGAAMRGLGRPMMQLMPQLFGLIAVTLMLLAFAGRGVEAIAWCMLARTALFLPLTIWFAHRLTGLQVGSPFRACLPVLASALAMAGAVSGWRSAMAGALSSPAMLASSILLGGVVYCSCVAVLDRRITREAIDLALIAAGRKPLAGADS